VSAPDLAGWAERIRSGDRRSLARAITLIESTRSDHGLTGQALLELLLAHSGGAVRLGVTGTPGVGKSTIIDTLGCRLIDQGHRVAVLAVDPSSNRTGGSILGDKTRMASLVMRPEAFIRPSPSGGVVGGVARRSRDVLLMCEAAGFDVVIVETMGVGQAETAVAEICDLFLLLVAPGGGDDLQGIKRGVMELADIVAVNKADGPMLGPARHTAADYRHALHLVRPKWPGILPPVLTCSALAGDGLDELWRTVADLHLRLDAAGHLSELRAEQAVSQLDREFSHLVRHHVERSPALVELRAQLEADVRSGRRSPTSAASELADRTWP
jgi:LAO/AO transport system kinase